MKIAAFTKYDRRAASTRQRVLQYVPSLEAASMRVDYYPLLGDDYVRSLAGGPPASRAKIAAAYVRRLGQLLRGPECDLVWIYAELFPYLPAAFEQLAFRSGKPVAYDFDDAFFVSYAEHASPVVRKLLGRKFEQLLTDAAVVCCGNSYLLDYAEKFNPRSVVIPTVVDTDLYRPIGKPEGRPLTIGWIGSPSTWPNVRPLLPMLARLCQRRSARFRVIGAGENARSDRFEGMDLIEWSEKREVAEVQSMDIGIMPLLDQPFQRGKSGYKLIQYMACGLPVVASPIGVNSEIVAAGHSGLLASGDKEWEDALNQLIDDPGERARMGGRARSKAEMHYSLRSQAPRLVDLFRSVIGAP